MTAIQDHNPNHPMRGRSRSSFERLPGERIFAELRLRPGATFLDLGCGPGDYAIRAAATAGDHGRIYAVDQNPEALELLREKAARLDLDNITILEQDLGAPLPLGQGCADVILICTVLHHPDLRNRQAELLAGICKLLKPDGVLVIVEMHKKEMPFGPPLKFRIAPEELELQVCAHGLERTGYTDLGAAYLLRFSPLRASGV